MFGGLALSVKQLLPASWQCFLRQMAQLLSVQCVPKFFALMLLPLLLCLMSMQSATGCW
jgi:hypothetical protein